MATKTKKETVNMQGFTTEQLEQMQAMFAHMLGMTTAPTPKLDVKAMVPQTEEKKVKTPKHVKYAANVNGGSYVKVDEKNQKIIMHIEHSFDSLRINKTGRASVGNACAGFVNEHDWIAPKFSSSRPGLVAIAKANGEEE